MLTDANLSRVFWFKYTDQTIYRACRMKIAGEHIGLAVISGKDKDKFLGVCDLDEADALVGWIDRDFDDLNEVERKELVLHIFLNTEMERHIE